MAAGALASLSSSAAYTARSLFTLGRNKKLYRSRISHNSEGKMWFE